MKPVRLLLTLSLAALTVFPCAFPQLTRLITGRAPSDPRFVAERTRFLRRLAALLRADGAPGGARPAGRARPTRSAARR